MERLLFVSVDVIMFVLMYECVNSSRRLCFVDEKIHACAPTNCELNDEQQRNVHNPLAVTELHLQSKDIVL